MNKGTLWVLIGLLVAAVLPPIARAQSPDAYEPDEGNPPWIANGEVQERSFYPEGDVDYARFRVKAGRWYEVRTQNLAPLVDTVLTVQIGALLYEDDDGGSEPLASAITFQAAETTDALITIATTQAVYSATQTYELYAAEVPGPTSTPTQPPLPTATLLASATAAPSATPTSTPTSTPTPPPTSTPPPTPTPWPTATPPKPLISFSAAPDRVDKPGDCVTLRWSVERASEVYLVHPNGNQEGVIGQDERQVCPFETGVYALKVYAPGGDETVEVTVRVAPPTPTPTPRPTGAAVGGSSPSNQKGTVHVVVYVDENRSQAYDPQEGVLGAVATLMSQADPGRVWTTATDEQGQAHFAKVPSGSYILLIPHLGYAEAASFRGEDLTLDVLVAPIPLPARIP
ncbi:MAG: hypothetical protein GX657_10125 [Chloroflexi bacterium]|nr:hypothetical protein [Chloroflexota bacterium]